MLRFQPGSFDKLSIGIMFLFGIVSLVQELFFGELGGWQFYLTLLALLLWRMYSSAKEHNNLTALVARSCGSHLYTKVEFPVLLTRKDNRNRLAFGHLPTLLVPSHSIRADAFPLLPLGPEF
jgi:hypothetical protein